MNRKSKRSLPSEEMLRNGAKANQFLAFALCLLSLTALTACDGGESRTAKKLKEDTAATEIEGSLVFENVTLDQADEQGRPLWEVKATKATYTPDRKVARVENPSGDLYQDGEIVLRVSAKSGEILENGKTVFLRGEVTATDTRNGTVFRGEEVEWRPEEDLLLVRNNLKGTHPQLQATANEGRYSSREQQVELSGKVEAIAKDPNLQMETERLVWQIEAEKVQGDQRIRMERYEDETVTDRVEADRSELDLSANLVTLTQNVQLTSIDPPVLMSSNAAVWNLDAQTVVSNQPVQIVHQKENLVLTANQGQMNLEEEVATLTGGVRGVGSRNQAELYANQLTWELPTQNMRASGNVIYKQVDPPFSTTGETAVGKLQDQSIVVRGSGNDRVVTEIIPQESSRR